MSLRKAINGKCKDCIYDGAAAYLGISVSTLYEWSAKGILPPPIKLTKNGRASGHPIEVLDELIERQISESRGQTT